MSGHPVRCVLDLACLGGVGLTVLGWLPILLASIASLLAIIHYAIWLRDRLHKPPIHHLPED